MRPPSPRSERAAWLAVAVAAALFAGLHTAIAALTWRSLRSEWALDLAYFHSQVWNASRGAGFAQSLHLHESQSLLGNTHFNPILLLGVPLQWVAPGLDSLLATQALLVALGGVAVARLARGHGASPWLAAGCALMFLMQAPLWQLVQSDVRPLVWSTPFLLMLAAALTAQRKREALIWAALACLCREELPVLVAAVALLHGAGRTAPWRRRWPLAAAVTGLAVVFLLGSIALRPEAGTYISPGMWLLEALGWPLELPRGVGPEPLWVEKLGERLQWLLGWGWPVALVAVGAPRLLLGAVPLLGYLLTSDIPWAGWDAAGGHYTAPAVALVGGAAAVTLARIQGGAPTGPAPFFGAARGAGEPRHGLAWAVLGAVLAVQAGQATESLQGWIAEDVFAARSGDADLRAVHELAALVPDDAPVMADYTTVALFAGRPSLYCYERDAMEMPEGAAAPGPLLPLRDEQPEWALVLSAHQDWVARAAAAGLVERGRSELMVLMGPPD